MNPVKAEVVRWDLKMPGPGSVYARLVATLPPVAPKIAAERGEPASARVLSQVEAKLPRLMPSAPAPAFGVRP